MRYYWLIKTIDDEYHSSDKYITNTLEDAEAHRMEYCGWYCNPGDVTLRKVDQQFNEVERIDYCRGKVIEHLILERDDKGGLLNMKYLIKNGRKVNKVR